MGRRRTRDRHLPPHMQRKGKVYYHTPYLNGRVVWIRLADNYSDALREWAQREGSTKSKGSTVGDALDRYLIDNLPKLAKATQREYQRYSNQLRVIFGAVHLDDVRPNHIAEYLDRHPASVLANREIAMLSSTFTAAMRWGWCDRNPCIGVRRNTERARSRLPEQAEIDAILAVAPDKIRIIVQLALLTSARKEDLLVIKTSDAGEEGLTIAIQKSLRANDKHPARRLLYEWTDDLRSVIDTARKLPRRAVSEFLITNRHGQPYTTTGFDSIWQRVLKKAGVSGVHFHDLRARSLTDAKNQGGIDYAVELAAHKSASTTARYLRDRETTRVRPVKRGF